MSSSSSSIHHQRALLLDRIQQYEAAGWIEATASTYYAQTIQRDPSKCAEISQQLERAVALEADKSITIRRQNKKKSHTAAALGVSNIPNQQRVVPHSSSVAKITSSRHDDKTKNKEESSDVILEPLELNDRISDSALKDLFVEMCFFARLAFIQPPCCLHCAHRETMTSSNNKNDAAASSSAVSSRNMDCENWVVWRKDATVALHPDQLSDNLIMVQCRAVRKLLSGQQVQGRVWVHERKQLVVINPNSKRVSR